MTVTHFQPPAGGDAPWHRQPVILSSLVQPTSCEHMSSTSLIFGVDAGIISLTKEVRPVGLLLFKSKGTGCRSRPPLGAPRTPGSPSWCPQPTPSKATTAAMGQAAGIHAHPQRQASAAAAAPLKAQVLLLAQLPKVEEQARAVLAELRGGSSEGDGEAVPETAAKGMTEVGALLERYVAAQRDVVAQLQA